MLDHKYRVRVNREPLVAGDKRQARNKKVLVYGGIGVGVILVILLILLLVGRGGGEPVDTSGPAEMTVRLERGTAEMQVPDADDFEELNDGDTVPEGAAIKTDSESLLSMELSTGSVVRLNEQSRVEIPTITSESLVVELVGGEIWSNVAQADATPITIETLELNATALGSVFNTEHGQDTTTVSVVDDKAQVTAVTIEEGERQDLASTELRSGDRVAVAADELPTEESDYEVLEVPDDFLESFWYRWNTELDEAFNLKLSGDKDTTAPTLTITEPKDGDETSEDTIEVKGITEVSASVKVNGKSAENDLGEFTAEVDLDEGENKITVIAEDAAGNEAKEELSITKKPAAPDSVSFSADSTAPGSVDLSWNESEAEDFESYDVRRDGLTISTITDITATYFQDTGLEEGQSYTYVICVVDTDGLETCSEEITATVQSTPNQAPSVSIIKPGVGDTVKGGAAVEFSATGTDPEGTELTYSWEFGDGQAASGQTVTHVYLAPTETVTLTVYVTATDAEGETSSSSITLTVTP